MTGTERPVVAAQAQATADAWSPPGAPESWGLTAATFAAIADEEALLDLAAAIPPDRLPPLLLAAALRFLAPGTDLARHYPQPGGPQPPPDPAFGAELAAFARERRFDGLLAEIGRDLEWVSVDPLMLLGPDARATVQGLDLPAAWVRENRDGGVFGVIGRVSVRDGVRTGTVLGRAHPGAAWLEWR
jgi:hypothetical protein